MLAQAPEALAHRQGGHLPNGSLPCCLFVTMFKTCTQTSWIHLTSYGKVFQWICFQQPWWKLSPLRRVLPAFRAPLWQCRMLRTSVLSSQDVYLLILACYLWICSSFSILSWLTFPLVLPISRENVFLSLSVSIFFSSCQLPLSCVLGSYLEIVIVSLAVQLQETIHSTWFKK